MATKLPDLQKTVSASASPVVRFLEERLRRTVTATEIADLAGLPPGSPRAAKLLRYLRLRGWLRPLALRGTYEFLPAVGGSLPSGDPWIELRAALARRPGIAAHVGLSSAAWLRGFADRHPLHDTVVWNIAVSAPPGLRTTYDVIRTSNARIFGATPMDGVPVATPSRLVLEAALWWQKAGDLRSPDHWLARALVESDPMEVRDGALKLGRAVVARAGYLARRFGGDLVAEALAGISRSGPVFLGPRSGSGRILDPEWGVYDTLGVGGAWV